MKINEKEPMNWVLNTIKLPDKTPFRSDEIENYFKITTGCPWSKLFKKDFIIKNNILFQNLKNSNDVFFVRTAMALANNLTYVKDPLATYRFAEGTNTQSNKHKNPLEFYKAYKALKDKLVSENLYEKFEKSFTNMIIEDIVFNYKTTNTEEAQKIIYEKVIDEGIEYFNISKNPSDYYNKDAFNEFCTIFNF